MEVCCFTHFQQRNIAMKSTRPFIGKIHTNILSFNEFAFFVFLCLSLVFSSVSHIIYTICCYKYIHIKSLLLVATMFFAIADLCFFGVDVFRFVLALPASSPSIPIVIAPLRFLHTMLLLFYLRFFTAQNVASFQLQTTYTLFSLMHPNKQQYQHQQNKSKKK